MSLKQKHPSCERLAEEERKSPAAVHPDFSKPLPPLRKTLSSGAFILVNPNNNKKK
jgi:hypothetical protein